MKKIFILILFFLTSISNAQGVDIGITGVNITSIAPNEINVNLAVITNASEYISSAYTINGNTINLSVCYITYGVGLIMNLENDIPITIPSNGNYNLNITIYQSFSTICDYNNIQDTRSLNFTTPINGTVTLSTTDNLIKNIGIFPNPTTGIVNINFFESASIDLFDNIGRKIKHFNDPKIYTIDIAEFENGIYFLKIDDFEKSSVHKIVLKK